MTATVVEPTGADGEGDTRARLVEVATELVCERGVAALRLDEVASRAGLHRSSVYRHVESKEDLVTAVLVSAALGVGRRVLEGLDADDPEELLVTGLSRSLVALGNDPVHRALQEPAASAAVARTVDRAVAEAIRPLVEPLIRAAEAQGVLRAGVTLDRATSWLLVVVSGLLASPNLLESDEALAELLRSMLVPSLLDAEAAL